MEPKFIRIDKTDPARIATAEFSSESEVLDDLQNRNIANVKVYEVCRELKFVERTRVIQAISAE